MDVPTTPTALRLIPSGSPRSTGMSTAAVAPLFPVPPTAYETRSCDENVKLLGPVCHVVEVQPAQKSGWTYALVHASPMGVARIATELGLEVYRSRKGPEYFAVVVAKGASASVPVAPASSPRPVASVPPTSALPVPEAWGGSAPARPRQTVSVVPGTVRMVIKGSDYVARETSPKRRMDVRRFEVRRDGELVAEPYVVSFQNHDATEAQCSCKDWIYRRHNCKHIQACVAVFARARQQAFAS